MKHQKVLLIIVITGILARFFFFIFAYLKIPLSSDEGIIGLMAMHILKGEFPIVFWGQPYMGTLEAFIDAPLIFLLGANAISVRIYPFVCSLLFMYLTYKLAAKIYNREIGLITLLLLAIPVPYLSECVFFCPGNNIGTVVLGSITLLISYNLVFERDVKNKTLWYAVLGFILGLGFWYHMLIVSYIVVVIALLFLKDKLLIIRRNFWVFTALFILGSFPIFLFNIKNNYITFYGITSGVGKYKILKNLKVFFKDTIQFLMGTKVMLYCDTIYYEKLPGILSVALLILLAILIAVIIITKFKNIWRIGVLSLKKTDGTVILLIVALVVIFVFCRTRRSNWWAVRYILPIISVLPILFAYGLWWIKKNSRIGFYTAISIILLAHGWGNIILIKAWNDPVVINKKLDFPDTKDLIQFLNEKNIKYAYATFWISYRLTYETKENIICSQPFNERFRGYSIPYINKVQKAENVAYILHNALGLKPEDFEERLKIIGGRYKKQEIDALPAFSGSIPTGFVVFYDFDPPYGKDMPTEISRSGWRVTSNFRADETEKAMDDDLKTRWRSGVPQNPGIYFLIDMGKVYEISKIRFDLGCFISDFPRGYEIEVSKGNDLWTKVTKMDSVYSSFFWEGSHPWCFVEKNFFNSVFIPIKARYIKITQIGMDPKFSWSIAEINIYG